MVTRLDFVRGSLAAAIAAGTAGPRAQGVRSTALDRYIARPTPEYSFEVIKTLDGNGYRFHVLSMVSQQWRSNREVDNPVWKHWLTIIEPEHIKTRVSVLVITGGSNTDEPPVRANHVVGEIAVRTGALVAELYAVPNQPLTFADEHSPRGEDDLVAYSWDKYLRTGDETWPLRLPMTKAVVRAMDTVTAFSVRAHHKPVVDRFIVGGSSKRGWTAWLTPAVDNRVVAIVPVVIDVLNIESSAPHSYRVYGSWPPALQAYEKMGIMKWFGTPQLEALLAIEDPYSYRERITVPKLIVNATGDQYFTPDSSQFYFSGLRGEKYLRYVPNTDHSLRGVTANAAQTGIAFVDSIIAGAARPAYSWYWDRDGTIHVRSTEEPLSVKLWQAVNPHARDFRLQTIGRAFRSSELRSRGKFTYAAKISPPAHGFAAYFVELTYETIRDDVFTFTTGVRVTPDILPFGPPPRAR